ncbi:MAG TPA: SCO family protein [Beijerinckiaceae bacterium]|jgi:protein SCO1/2
MPLSDRTRRLVLPLAAFLLGLVVLGVAVVLTLAPASRPAGTAAVGGPFRLVDQDGRTVTDRDFNGAPHLVFFGFTRCPDICPTKLFELSEVLRATGDKGRRLRALFITVDPERDTPEAMKSYVSSFDERIVGLTGDPEAIQATVRAYRAFARKVPLKDGDYTMEHTALVYLMDKDGRFVGSFNLNRPPAEAARDLVGRL